MYRSICGIGPVVGIGLVVGPTLVESLANILGQKSNGPLQTMDCKMLPVRPIFINCISHSSAATARQYRTNFNH